MSRHGFEYSISPSRPAGWRSFLANFLMVITVAAVSAISGAVVALELLGPDKPGVRATARIAPAPMRVAQPSAPATAAPAVIELPRVLATIVQPVPQAVAAPAPQPAVAPAPQQVAAPAPPAAPAPTAAPAQAVALADAHAVAQVPESELTFTHGYARRRAVQDAANAASGQVARVESETQFGREAVKVRPRTVARVDSRAADARGLFWRFDQPARYDSSRHLAYGDPRTNQNRRSQGGPFGSGGFFGSLF
jgi:hypothetical protein